MEKKLIEESDPTSSDSSYFQTSNEVDLSPSLVSREIFESTLWAAWDPFPLEDPLAAILSSKWYNKLHISGCKMCFSAYLSSYSKFVRRFLLLSSFRVRVQVDLLT